MGMWAVETSGKGASWAREFGVLSGGGIRLISMGESVRGIFGTDRRRWRYRGRAIDMIPNE